MPLGDGQYLKKSTWWGATVPPTIVSLAANTWVGVQFSPVADTYIWGGRIYVVGALLAAPLFAIWEWLSDAPVSVWCNKYGSFAPPASQWLQSWSGRRVRVLAGHTYAFCCQAQHQYWRHTAQLAAPVTVGNLQFKAGFQSTALEPWASVPTLNTNANGVDVLEGKS